MKNHHCNSTIKTPNANHPKNSPLIKIISQSFIDLPTSQHDETSAPP
jgi:hypothetical protein